MKRILIIGKNSYIGKSFAKFAGGKYEITVVNSRNNAWENVDFSGYDSVLHCAGIAHISHSPKLKSLYYEINCDLAVNVVKKAAKENVNQFIFLSSILVYGNKNLQIDNTTLPNPDNHYGGSKLKAEQELQKLSDENFKNLKLCIVRSPMVYGPGCKGNFPKLVKLSKIMPVFPAYPNRRSMIYIENLCAFLCALIDGSSEGVFLPQNEEYVNTAELIRLIAAADKKRIVTTKLFNPLIKPLADCISVFQKLFGSLYYAKQENENEYSIVSFEESIRRSMAS